MSIKNKVSNLFPYALTVLSCGSLSLVGVPSWLTPSVGEMTRPGSRRKLQLLCVDHRAFLQQESLGGCFQVISVSEVKGVISGNKIRSTVVSYLVLSMLVHFMREKQSQK